MSASSHSRAANTSAISSANRRRATNDETRARKMLAPSGVSLAGVSDEGAIDERIKALVDAHRPELERLVDQALERELNQTAKPAMPAPAAKTTSKRCEG